MLLLTKPTGAIWGGSFCAWCKHASQTVLLYHCRTLDPSLRIPYPIALFVRLKAIIVNFEALRMIITHDEVSLRWQPGGTARTPHDACLHEASQPAVQALSTLRP
jgi:hypothetical protein